jgi:hypothetical protein
MSRCWDRVFPPDALWELILAATVSFPGQPLLSFLKSIVRSPIGASRRFPHDVVDTDAFKQLQLANLSSVGGRDRQDQGGRRTGCLTSYAIKEYERIVSAVGLTGADRTSGTCLRAIGR